MGGGGGADVGVAVAAHVAELAARDRDRAAADLGPRQGRRATGRLIRFCREAAQARYVELTDYLVVRRLGVPEHDSTDPIEGMEELPK
jgi:hypothetical protein